MDQLRLTLQELKTSSQTLQEERDQLIEQGRQMIKEAFNQGYMDAKEQKFPNTQTQAVQLVQEVKEGKEALQEEPGNGGEVREVDTSKLIVQLLRSLNNAVGSIQTSVQNIHEKLDRVLLVQDQASGPWAWSDDDFSSGSDSTLEDDLESPGNRK